MFQMTISNLLINLSYYSENKSKLLDKFEKNNHFSVTKTKMIIMKLFFLPGLEFPTQL